MKYIKNKKVWIYSIIALFFITAFGIIVNAYITEDEVVTKPVDMVAEATPTSEPTPTPTKEPANENEEDKEEIDESGLKEGQMRSFLSGLPVDKEIGEKRPIAIMFNNVEQAQPMWAISQADVVYEYVV